MLNDEVEDCGERQLSFIVIDIQSPALFFFLSLENPLNSEIVDKFLHT